MIGKFKIFGIHIDECLIDAEILCYLHAEIFAFSADECISAFSRMSVYILSTIFGTCKTEG